jgi:hypothetical protein
MINNNIKGDKKERKEKKEGRAGGNGERKDRSVWKRTSCCPQFI